MILILLLFIASNTLFFLYPASLARSESGGPLLRNKSEIIIRHVLIVTDSGKYV